MTNDEFVEKRFVRRLHEMGIYDEVVRLIRPRGVPVEALVSRARHKHVSAARHEIMYWIRMKMKWSFPAIGKLFNRDHTTIMSACRKIYLENPTFGGAIPDPYDVSEWLIR